MGWSDGNRSGVVDCGGGGVAAAVVVIVEGKHCCLSCGTSGSSRSCSCAETVREVELCMQERTGEHGQAGRCNNVMSMRYRFIEKRDTVSLDRQRLAKKQAFF